MLTSSRSKYSKSTGRPSQRLLHALRGHRHPVEANSDGVVDGVGDGRTDDHDCRLAAALRRVVLGVDDHGLDLGQPRESGIS